MTPMNLGTLLGLAAHGADAEWLCLLAGLALVALLASGFALLGRATWAVRAPRELGLLDLWRLTSSPSRLSTGPPNRSAVVTGQRPTTGDLT